MAHVMRDRIASLTMTATLDRAALMLVARVVDLEGRIQSGEDALWGGYTDAVQTLALVVSTLSPECRGELLTTREMAARLRIRPKTLLKRKGKGQIHPALQAGKLIRWRGTETVSHPGG